MNGRTFRLHVTPEKRKGEALLEDVRYMKDSRPSLVHFGRKHSADFLEDDALGGKAHWSLEDSALVVDRRSRCEV